MIRTARRDAPVTRIRSPGRPTIAVATLAPTDSQPIPLLLTLSGLMLVSVLYGIKVWIDVFSAEEIACPRNTPFVHVTVSRHRQSQLSSSTVKLRARDFPRAGKTGWTEVLVFSREFIDIQRDYVESLAEARLAGIELDLAAGQSPSTSHP